MYIPEEIDKQFNITEPILHATQYTGKREKRRFSGSMWGMTNLQLWLEMNNDDIQKEEINQSTIGSLFHIGMEHIDKANMQAYIEVEVANTIHTKNHQWTITGTIDRIIEVIKDKQKYISIQDHKLTKSYVGVILKKEWFQHSYIRQLNTYKWIHQETINQDKQAKYDMRLNLFYKDGEELNHVPHYEIFEVPQIPEFEKLLLNKLKEIDQFIDNEEPPEKCEDIWWRKDKQGRSVPTRCTAYCNVNHLCPYYRPPSIRQKAMNW